MSIVVVAMNYTMNTLTTNQMNRFHLLFLILLMGGAMLPLQATHIQGGELSYTPVGPNEYEVTLAYYRDCAGIPLATSYGINYDSPGGCGTSGSFNVPLVSGPLNVTPLCPSYVLLSRCNGGTLPGVEQGIYQARVTLPTACTDWTFSISTCCRNGAITTGPSGGIHIFATLNSVDAPNNTSPAFSSLPVPYICINDLYTYNHGAVEPDGDSLAYSLVAPYTSDSTQVTYGVGYSAKSPISSSPGLTLDPINGNIVINPNNIEVTVMGVLVEEYRNGVLIGSIIRDIQIAVLNCNNDNPVIDSITNLVNGTQVAPQAINICPGVPFSFDIAASDADSTDLLYMSWNNGIPAGTFTVANDSSNAPIGSFSWTPTLADSGFKSFTISVKDDACPSYGSSVVSFDIYVYPNGTTIGPDRIYCQNSSPIQLLAQGGSNFTWNVLSGDANSLSCTNCANPQANPNTTTVYEVTSNLDPLCKSKDTVIVTVTQSISVSTQIDTTICEGQSLDLTAVPSPNGNYNYQWSPAIGLSSTNTSATMASPTTTTSYEILISVGNCTARDSITVDVSEIPPFNMSSSNGIVLCNTSTTLSTGFTGNYLYQWSPSNTLSGSLVPNPVAMPTDSNTVYEVIVTDQGSGCMFSDSISIEASTMSVTPFATVCSTQNQSATLAALYSGPIGQPDPNNYTVDTIAYNPQTITGTTVSLGDDQVSADLPIGFDFTFFGNTFTTFKISSNGFITFTGTNSGCCSGQNIPNASLPNDLIAWGWYDLYPPGNGSFTYETIGTSPHQMLVMQATDIPFCCNSNPAVTSQVILYEGSNLIEIHVNSITNISQGTIGIENSDGTVAFAPKGKNSSSFSVTQEAWSFTFEASGGTTYSWTPTTGLNDPSIANPIAMPGSPTTYHLTIDNGNGCVMTDSTVVTMNCSFPIEMLEFTATGVGTNVLLDWTTLREENSSHIEVEHSLNGYTFSYLGQVAASGNSETPKSYQYLHKLLGQDRHYYRLRLVDMDGSFSYSDIVSVRLNGNDELDFELYPNPAKEEVNLHYMNADVISFKLEVFDQIGKILRSEDLPTAPGAQLYQLDISELPVGVYYIKLTQLDSKLGTIKATHKLLVE